MNRAIFYFVGAINSDSSESVCIGKKLERIDVGIVSFEQCVSLSRSFINVNNWILVMCAHVRYKIMNVSI